MNKLVVVREATPEDAVPIGRIYHESWLATYPNKEAGITIEEIEKLGLDSGRTAQKKAEKLSKPDGKSFRYVAEIAGMVVGHCGIELHQDYGHLCSIYILPEHTSQGVGSALMQMVLEKMADCPEILLGVASYNERAIRFYERFGFVRTKYPRREIYAARLPGGKEIPQYHMVRKR